jgi:hypothetical protein
VVGLDLPLHVDVPAEDHAAGRVVGQHASPAALAAVHADVVEVPAHARLEHHLGDLGLEDVVVGVPPALEVLGEDLEGVVDRGVDDDRGAHGGVGHGHVSSPCSRRPA